MAYPGRNIGDVQTVRRKELRDVVRQILLDDGRDIRRKDEAESGGTDVPTHGVLRVGVEVATRSEDVWARGADLLGAPFAEGYDCRGTVAEQSGPAEASCRASALPRQR